MAGYPEGSGQTIAEVVGSIPGPFKYQHINSNATTVVKAAPGFLHSIVVNQAGSSWVAEIFDSTSASGTIVANSINISLVTSFIYDITLNTGITIVTSGTTPGDITVVWR